MIEGSISESEIPMELQTGFTCESLIDGLLHVVCVCVYVFLDDKKRMKIHASLQLRTAATTQTLFHVHPFECINSGIHEEEKNV